MKLIVGLGNPDKKYLKTRHNVGFMAVDLFAKQENLNFKFDSKFSGFIAEYNNGNTKTIILKPTTYMNLSGNSVIKVINYYKIKPENVLVIYDDVDVDLGKLRLRLTGSSGGHKGMQDIINHLNTKEIKRVRVGIGKDEQMIDYVLSKFSKKEKKILDPVLDQVVEVISMFIRNEDFSLIMNRFNGL